MNFVELRGFVLFIVFQLALLLYLPLHAQSPDIRFKSITKEDGLSSNKVMSAVKDKLGFLWIATNKGLCRYDTKGRMNKNKTNSSGLGLAICAKIIARLGGKIWMESKPNEGSTVYVLLENRTLSERN